MTNEPIQRRKLYQEVLDRLLLRIRSELGCAMVVIEQAGWRQHQKHQVGQIAHRLGPHELGLARDKAHQDEQHHGQKRGQDGMIKVHPWIISVSQPSRTAETT